MRYSSKQQAVHPGVRARDLPALMELYELNYMQLRQLVPDLDAVQDHSTSRVKGTLDLHLTVRERCRYTSTLHLTYEFADNGGSFPAPDVVVRMYHDAQMAEVISRGGRPGRGDAEYDRFRHQYSIEIKWQNWVQVNLRKANLFLRLSGIVCFSRAYAGPNNKTTRT